MKQLNLLLIEDSEADFEIVKQKLKNITNRSFKTTWANSFELGKSLINNRKFDLILLDTILFDGDGLELLAFARENNNKKPIIIITGAGNLESDLLALSYGADDYVVKSDLSDTSLERSIRYTIEKYKAKLELSQREERYRNLFEKSLDAIAIVNINFELTEVNHSMANLFDENVSNLIGKKLSDFFYQEKSYEKFYDLVDNWGLVKKFRARLRSESNTKILAEINSILLFDIDNQISGYQIIIKDLSKEKLNEQRLIRAEKLGMTGRIARSIAHEVRNPLTNINLAIEQLKEDIPSTETNDMYVEIVNRNSGRINKLITELLNSSKPSALKFEISSLKSVIEDAIALASDRINLNDIKLIKEIDSDINLKLDSIQFKTAILNILINAIEAVEMSKGLIHVKIAEYAEEVQVVIKDNGVGMSREKLNKLFDPFFTGKSTGMGLGMTSTQNIIQQHNGNIDVESEEDKGTTIYINLPKLVTNHG